MMAKMEPCQHTTGSPHYNSFHGSVGGQQEDASQVGPEHSRVAVACRTLASMSRLSQPRLILENESLIASLTPPTEKAGLAIIPSCILDHRPASTRSLRPLR